ncbi:MAG: DUF374 domain-containing protein [Bacteroidetes bacterium]|nr:DUF374 domain-containing protein [Bacteroidota bacterium]
MKNFLGLKLLPLIINLYIKTLRIKLINPPPENKNCIFIFWHSKMLAGWWLLKDKNPAALVSRSKDGDILNNILMKWNYKVVRGSSSSGAKEALQMLCDLVNEGFSAVITPDGPRGPALKIKNGPLVISFKCGVPVIPVSIDYSIKKVLSKSWDKFEIPVPFSVCTVKFGSEYLYEEYLEENELEALKSEISSEMK